MELAAFPSRPGTFVITELTRQQLRRTASWFASLRTPTMPLCTEGTGAACVADTTPHKTGQLVHIKPESHLTGAKLNVCVGGKQLYLE